MSNQSRDASISRVFEETLYCCFLMAVGTYIPLRKYRAFISPQQHQHQHPFLTSSGTECTSCYEENIHLQSKNKISANQFKCPRVQCLLQLQALGCTVPVKMKVGCHAPVPVPCLYPDTTSHNTFSL